MPVHIKEIDVRDLGPIREWKIELGPFNLIYAKNERGKTFLIEFLIRSLFKSASNWKLRSFSAAGRVEVKGLDKDPVSFSPTSHVKLEDFLEEKIVGMPPNLSKLLVVKGAELSMAENEPGGVSRTVLKEYLSSEALLDAIRGKISQTILKAAMVDGEIEGSNMGEIKKRREAKENIDRIDKLIKEIDEVYSGGKRALLGKQLEETNQAIEQMELAKQHKAYALYQEIRNIEKDKGELSKEALTALWESFTSYNETVKRINTHKKEVDDLKEASENYNWLRSAIEEYKERTHRGVIRGWKLFAVFTIIGFLIAFASLCVTLLGSVGIDTGVIIAIVFLLFGGLFGFLYLRAYKKFSESFFDAHEIRQIANEYESKFGEVLTSIATMENLKVKLYSDHVKRETLESQVNKDSQAIVPIELKIRDALMKFNRNAEDKEKWSDEVDALDRRLSEFEKQINDKKTQLIALDVDAPDYEERDPGVKYQKPVLEGLKEKSGNLEQELHEEFTKLENLKQSICRETGDEITIDWEKLIENLRKKREDQVKEYRRITSEILAKILIKDQLEIICQQEDQKIQDSLNSDTISRPLEQITHRYKKVSIAEDTMVVSDAFDEFPLEDLSTGAQEQVLLALRIGFAGRILGKESLFLILDDAFQHADWDRRDWLLDEILMLANQGWQIIYLTMDDHIRDIFNREGSNAFKKEYRFIDLEAEIS